jgi:hypothetical protein
MSYFTRQSDGAMLHVYVQPKASKTRIVGIFDGCLKIAIAAPPVEGKANEEVVKFLARLFNIPGRAVVIQAGAQSRRKRVFIQTTGVDLVLDKIEKILADSFK